MNARPRRPHPTGAPLCLRRGDVPLAAPRSRSQVQRDRLLRRVTKKYGSDERIVVRAAKSDIVCRAIMICLKAWDAGYRPEGRHPSQIKQDLAVAFAIRINCARGGKPVSAIQLRRRL